MNTPKYKVLAADDEYWSRENIRNLISWDEYSIEFLEPACDGEEVMERIPEDRPDIILTDINMPFLSGLELLERLNKEYPDIITVAVSGYDDFAKVKGVFISGGMDYLLKPVGEDELINVLTKALGILKEREVRKKSDENSLLQKYKLASFLEDTEYSALLSGNLYGGSEKQLHDCSSYSFPPMSFVLVKFYDISDIAAMFDHNILEMSWSIKSRLREFFGAERCLLLFHYNSKTSEFLLAGTASLRELQGFAQKVLTAFSKETYGPVSIVLHEQKNLLEDIGTVYREMLAVLVTRPFRRTHCILRCVETDKDSSQQTAWKSVDVRLEEELYHLLLTRQKAGVHRLIFETCDFEYCEEQGWSYLDVKQYVGRVTNILFRYVQSQLPEIRALTEEAMDNVDYYMGCLDAREMLTTLKLILDSLWENENGESSASITCQVQHIRRFIEKNYYENITLASLAEKYHVDASYLSRIFSKKYGESIIAFLTRVRMEHAVELMKDPDKTLETISFLVGYDDYNYFSRVFRKKQGISPSGYRRTYLSM
ncbi:MAG: response regulator [Eubacteriales bacterium]|nr:response regulator [Eubacteriales bacterium]